LFSIDSLPQDSSVPFYGGQVFGKLASFFKKLSDLLQLYILTL